MFCQGLNRPRFKKLFFDLCPWLGYHSGLRGCRSTPVPNPDLLDFYGILPQEGEPTRYRHKPDLAGMLHAFLVIHDHHSGEQALILASIDDALSERMAKADRAERQRPSFRALTAKWLRTRDLAGFVGEEPSQYPLRLAVARLLHQPREIAVKWELILSLLAQNFASADAAWVLQELSCQESGLGRLLQWVALHFLEQDPEPPPPNLRLELVRGRFPLAAWRQGEQLLQRPAPFWQPKNPLCRAEYLSHQLLWQLLQGKSQKTGQALSFPLPSEPPLALEFHFPGSLEQEGQMTLQPLDTSASLLELQRRIQRDLPAGSLRQFFALLRQMTQQAKFRNRLDLDQHLAQLGLEQGAAPKKQEALAELQTLLAYLNQVEVRRKYREGAEHLESTNPLITSLGADWVGFRALPKRLNLLLDPLFEPNPHNPYRLGGHLALLPDALLHQKGKAQAWALPLTSYLYGAFLWEFPSHQGLHRCRLGQLVAGAGLPLSAQAKTNLLTKLGQELDHLTQKGYLAAWQAEGQPGQHPEDLTLTLQAPANLVSQLGPVTPAPSLPHA